MILALLIILGLLGLVRLIRWRNEVRFIKSHRKPGKVINMAGRPKKNHHVKTV